MEKQQPPPSTISFPASSNSSATSPNNTSTHTGSTHLAAAATTTTNQNLATKRRRPQLSQTRLTSFVRTAAPKKPKNHVASTTATNGADGSSCTTISRRLPTRCAAPATTETEVGSVRIVQGSLLDATEAYLCHQGNCVTLRPAGLAATLFQAFPYANVYAERTASKITRSKPGTIALRGGSNGKRAVVTLMAQYYPGTARFGNDSTSKRLQWFVACLDKLAELPMADNGFAFPYLVGCGLAGGSWLAYLDALTSFAKRARVPVTVYRLRA